MACLLFVLRVALFQALEDSNFYFACIAVLGNRPNNFDGYPPARDLVQCFHDFTKGSLTQKLDCAICENGKGKSMREAIYINIRVERALAAQNIHRLEIMSFATIM